MDVIDTLCGFNREQLLEILSLHIQTATFPVRHAGPQKEPGAKTKKWWGGPVGKVLRYGQSLDHASVIHFLKKEWKGFQLMYLYKGKISVLLKGSLISVLVLI